MNATTHVTDSPVPETQEAPPGQPEGERPAPDLLEEWIELERALREGLPVCTTRPPNQPTELLTALRVTDRIDGALEERVRALRALRNRAAHDPDFTPSAADVRAFRSTVRDVRERLTATRDRTACPGP